MILFLKNKQSHIYILKILAGYMTNVKMVSNEKRSRKKELDKGEELSLFTIHFDAI